MQEIREGKEGYGDPSGEATAWPATGMPPDLLLKEFGRTSIFATHTVILQVLLIGCHRYPQVSKYSFRLVLM